MVYPSQNLDHFFGLLLKEGAAPPIGDDFVREGAAH
jgi:hypothetical protein